MKSLFTFSFSLLTLLLAACGTAEKSLMPTDDLSNWRIVDGQASEGTTAEQIVLTENEVMIYAPADKTQPLPEFVNFELSAMVSTSADAASSLWVHHGEGYGYEIVLGPTRIDGRKQTTGSLNNIRNIFKTHTVAEQWFLLEVAVRGKNITVAVDGVPVVDYVEPAEPFRSGEVLSFLDKGTVVLDSWRGTTRVKDMKILPLADDVVGRTDAVEEKNNDIIMLQQAGFPVIDFHVHLKGWDVAQALENSRRVGIFYGLAPNCGIGFQYTNDAEVDVFIRENSGQSAFMAMQGEGREWPTTFSAETRDKFDYVFTDALTFTDHAGRRVRLWIDEEVIIDVPQEQYMELIVDKIVEVVSTEPIDIYVNPFFLPTAMTERYDEWWTDERIKRVIDVLVEKGVALEVNARYRIPNAKTIKMAMEAGVPLAFGTNNGSAEDIGALEYPIEMIKQCGITYQNMYFPN